MSIVNGKKLLEKTRLLMVASALMVSWGCDNAEHKDKNEGVYYKVNKQQATICDSQYRWGKTPQSLGKYLKYNAELDCYAYTLNIEDPQIQRFRASVGGANLGVWLDPEVTSDMKIIPIQYSTVPLEQRVGTVCKKVEADSSSDEKRPLSYILNGRFGKAVSDKYIALHGDDSVLFNRCLNTVHWTWLSEDKSIFINCDAAVKVCEFHLALEETLIINFGGYEKTIPFVAANIDFIVKKAIEFID